MKREEGTFAVQLDCSRGQLDRLCKEWSVLCLVENVIAKFEGYTVRAVDEIGWRENVRNKLNESDQEYLTRLYSRI